MSHQTRPQRGRSPWRNSDHSRSSQVRSARKLGLPGNTVRPPGSGDVLASTRSVVAADTSIVMGPGLPVRARLARYHRPRGPGNDDSTRPGPASQPPCPSRASRRVREPVTAPSHPSRLRPAAPWTRAAGRCYRCRPVTARAGRLAPWEVLLCVALAVGAALVHAPLLFLTAGGCDEWHVLQIAANLRA